MPDDCGGVSGYEDILRIIQDPEDSNYEHFRSLLGEGEPVSVGVEDGADASPGTVWNGEFSNLGLIPEWNWPFLCQKVAEFYDFIIILLSYQRKNVILHTDLDNMQ